MAIYIGTENASLYGGISVNSTIDSISVNGEELPIVDKNVNIEIPTSYPATSITEDANHKFVTEAEKVEWNGKSDFSGSYTDLTNKPTSYPASAITQDTTHRFVTDAEKAKWDGKANDNEVIKNNDDYQFIRLSEGGMDGPVGGLGFESHDGAPITGIGVVMGMPVLISTWEDGVINLSSLDSDTSMPKFGGIIRNLKEPIQDTDAVNKKYVDDLFKVDSSTMI